MKNFLLIGSLLFALSSQAAITIVSDLDDTIKITEARGVPTDFLREMVYTGMPEFFQSAKEYSDSLYVISAGPSILSHKVKETLRKKGIVFNKVILRSNFTEDKFTYKVKEIKKLMEASSDDFLFFGDDLGKDPEVYAEMKRLYPNRVLGIYIHVVRGRSFTNDAVPYWTSLDLFLREFEASRMSAKAVELILTKLLKEKDLDFIFPKKAQCPKEATVWDWQTRTIFMQEATQLMNKFVHFCQARQSSKNLQ
jgi:phosphatidate phosphatase APP1